MKTSIIHSICIVLFLGSSPLISATQGMAQNNLRIASFPLNASRNQVVRTTGMRGFGLKMVAAPLQAARRGEAAAVEQAATIEPDHRGCGEPARLGVGQGPGH